ncbi:MAG TPA: RNA polymerase sigma factor [Pilimelia sp.]|nr:RNA polymerase sigma factor [Pilimelia sp.]
MGTPRNRDQDWFTRTYTDHYAYIVNYGRRRLADADQAAELAQEVFVVAWRRRGEVPDHSLPWLYGVARRLLANQWRAARAAPAPVPLPHPDLLARHHSGDPAGATGVADIRVALAGLSALDQEILRLIGWEELTVAEAARVLGCTSATAAVRLHRARRRLARALATTAPAGLPAPAPAHS